MMVISIENTPTRSVVFLPYSWWRPLPSVRGSHEAQPRRELPMALEDISASREPLLELRPTSARADPSEPVDISAAITPAVELALPLPGDVGEYRLKPTSRDHSITRRPSTSLYSPPSGPAPAGEEAMKMTMMMGMIR